MSQSHSKKSHHSRKGPMVQNPNSFRMTERPPDGPPVELENQFIMKLPEEPASALRTAIKSGASNLKERLFIQLEPDKSSNTQYLRRGHVQFDGWTFTSRLVDLPTVLESHKTIDSKTFYKTADIAQMLMCKEGEGWSDDEEGSPVKKKKDPNKVDKKYLYPHGIGPPLKNCRKRRFRKTLKKKYVEAPEIEKEVKRLLRVDNDAVSVKWEVITEEELNANKGGEAGQTDNPAVKPSACGGFTNDPNDLGLELTDSEEEGGGDVDIDSDENSRLSGGEDSRMSDSLSHTQEKRSSPSRSSGPTQFSKEMFAARPSATSSPSRPSRQDQLASQRMEMMHLASKKKELEHNIANCPNEALRNRFRTELQQVQNDIKRLDAAGFT